MSDLRIVGDAEASYLVADVENDEGVVEAVQLAKFESERGRKTFERLLGEVEEKAWMYEELKS